MHRCLRTSEQVFNVMNQRTITLAVAALVLGAAAPASAQQAPQHAAVHHTTGSHPAHPFSAQPGTPSSAVPSTPSESPAASASPTPAVPEAAPTATEPSAPAANEPTPEPPPPPPLPPATPPLPPLVLRGESRPERWVATVLAVGALAGTIASGVIALGDQSAFNARPSQDAADATARDGMIADAFLGLTLVSAAAAVVLFAFPHADGPRQEASNSGSRGAPSVRFRANGLAVRF